MKELVKCPESEIWSTFGRDLQNLLTLVGVFPPDKSRKIKINLLKQVTSVCRETGHVVTMESMTHDKYVA